MNAPATRIVSGFNSTEREFTIGQLAQEFGVSLRTLRFYEDRGLITPRRAGSGRHYSHADRMQLAQILKAKQLGFTLSEIKDIVVSGSKESPAEEISLSPAAIEQQISHLEQQWQEVTEALASLRKLKAALQQAA
jgi:DNA-binding transcriptional MerR regulator